ncbi:hypothetical protein [Pleurocapsa sp. PCC 7319]|uniref:hypothetical protein n=1 Tax=Pleurocapsa sp. PCC 7319 TaxID=118161 RepID=UPI000345E7C5|nr:hypothetical protein [Pleurocapsa sp. PCC 7319]
MGIAFEIAINDETKIVAGMEEISVLSFILCYHNALRDKNENLDSIELQVGGLLHHARHDDEHLDWIKRHLKIGDEIKIRVVESSDLTQPIARRRQDPKLVEKAQRKYYENLKQEYGE